MILWPPRNTYIITECLTNPWYSHYSLLELLNVMCVRFMTHPGVWLYLCAGTCVGLSRCEHLPLWIRISRGVCMCMFLVFGGSWWCLLCNLFFTCVKVSDMIDFKCALPIAIKWRCLIMLYDDILGVTAHFIACHFTCLGELTTFSHVVSSSTSLVICCFCCSVCQSCRSFSSVCSLSHSGQQSVLCDWSTFVYSPKNPCTPALLEPTEFYLFK